MKKVWKWIIGIVVALLVIGLVVGAVFMVRSHHLTRAVADEWVRPGSGTRGPETMPYFDDGRGYGMHMRGPGMMGFGFMPLGGLMLIFRLGLLALAVWGVILLVKALRKPAAVAQPVQPAEPELHCKKCGYTIQTVWKNCPNCGKKL